MRSKRGVLIVDDDPDLTHIDILSFHADNLPLALLEFDKDLRVTRWSAQATRAFGWTEAEVLGKKLNDWPFVHREDADAVEQGMARLSAGMDARSISRNRNYTRDGNIRRCEWYNSALLDDDGHLISILSLAQDVTDRLVAEEEMARRQAELEEHVAERSAELELAYKDLETFAYSVSHDLRAPLRAISGFAQIITGRHRASLNPEGQHYFDNIVLASERMGRLIDDLLTYSRLGRRPVQLQLVSLQDAVEAVASDLAPRISATATALEVATDLPEVSGDPTLVEQIFANLLDNALTYRRPDVRPHVVVSWQPAGRWVIVRVGDNGIGIAPEYFDKIFNIFQRLHSDDDYPGTGIGLATVKKAVTLLRGRVWVESVEGEGSAFFVQLRKGAQS